MKKLLIGLCAFAAASVYAGEGCCPYASKSAKKSTAAVAMAALAQADASCDVAKADCDTMEECIAAGKDPSSCTDFAVSKALGSQTLASLNLTPAQLASLDKAYPGKSLHCQMTRAKSSKEVAGILSDDQIATVNATLAKLGQQVRTSQPN